MVRSPLGTWPLVVVAVCAVQALSAGGHAAAVAPAGAPSELTTRQTHGPVGGDATPAPAEGDATPATVEGNATSAPMKGNVTQAAVEGDVPRALVKNNVTPPPVEGDITPAPVEGDATPAAVEGNIVLVEQSAPPRRIDALLDEMLTEVFRYFETQLQASKTATLMQVTARLDALQEAVSRLSSQQEITQDTVIRLSNPRMFTQEGIASHVEVTQNVAKILSSEKKLSEDAKLELASVLTIFQKELSGLSNQVVVLQQKQEATAARRLDFSERVRDLEATAYHTTKLGFPCRNDTYCKGVSELAVCTNHTCTCPENYRNHANVDCWPEKLGFQCKSNSSCQGVSEHAVCTNHTCSCLKNYKNHDGVDCWPEKLGLHCESDSSCQSLSEVAVCAGRTCSCQTNYRNHDDIDCWPEKLGLHCETNSSCQIITGYAECVNHTCVCPERYWNFGNLECRPEQAAGRQCQHNQDCFFGDCQGQDRYRYHHSAAMNGICSCEVEHGMYDYKLSECGSYGNVILRRKRGNWGYVCDDSWDNADATVMCKSLGFRRGVAQCCQTSTTLGDTNFLMHDVKCVGNETSLMSCPHSDGGGSDCTSSNVSAVSCY